MERVVVASISFVMFGFLLRRLFAFALTIWIATIVVFAFMELLPGDPAALMLGVSATPETLEALRHSMGIDQPILARYAGWISGMLGGDFGYSYTYRAPVGELILQRAVVSLPLALLAFVLSTLVAIPVAAFAAGRRGRFADFGVMAASRIGMAIPNFWFALLLIYVFAIWLGAAPAGGFPGWQGGWGAGLKSLTLPALALALPQAAILASVARSQLVETLGEDFVRTARAKGLSKQAALWRHALKNALVPVFALMGLQFAYLLAGTIIIENVFALPGLGRLIFQAITQRDLIVVESAVVLLVMMVIVVNAVVDVASAMIDPRLRDQR